MYDYNPFTGDVISLLKYRDLMSRVVFIEIAFKFIKPSSDFLTVEGLLLFGGLFCFVDRRTCFGHPSRIVPLALQT
jgi:hypothetical protein